MAVDSSQLSNFLQLSRQLTAALKSQLDIERARPEMHLSPADRVLLQQVSQEVAALSVLAEEFLVRHRAVRRALEQLTRHYAIEEEELARALVAPVRDLTGTFASLVGSNGGRG